MYNKFITIDDMSLAMFGDLIKNSCSDLRKPVRYENGIPKFECKKNDDSYKITIALPGVGKENVSVNTFYENGNVGYLIEVDENVELDEYKNKKLYVYSWCTLDNFFEMKSVDGGESNVSRGYFKVDDKIDINKSEISMNNGLLVINVPMIVKKEGQVKFEIK